MRSLFRLGLSLSAVGAWASVVSAEAPAVPAASIQIATYSATHAEGATILTLDQSVTTALRQATAVLKARNNVDFSGAQLVQAYLQFLPNLEGSATYTDVHGRNYFTQATPSIVDTSNHGGTYQIASALNIFNGFSDVAGLRASANRKKAANLTLARAQQEIAFDVTQSYLQVLLDREIVRIGEVNLQSSRERVRLLQAQADVGSRSLADLYRQQAQASSDELFLINARNRAQDDLLALLRRLRVDLLTPYDVAPVTLSSAPLQSPLPHEREMVQTALRQRADLEASEEAARAAQSDVTIARAGYLPRLDLVGNMTGTGRILNRQTVGGLDVVPPTQRPLRDQWGDQILYTGGASLTWGLFNRYSTQLAVAGARERAANSTIDAEDRRLQVEGEVLQAVNDYETALQRVASAEQGLKSAQESYAAVQARYQVGASSIVDLLIAQSALVQAEASQAEARIGFTLQEKAVALALGTLQTGSR